jgi:hypothetical protein
MPDRNPTLLYNFLALKNDEDPDQDPLVRGMDPRIRIRIYTNISWVRNTVCAPPRPKRARKVYHAKFSPIHHADMLTQLPKLLLLRSKKILGMCERFSLFKELNFLNSINS